MTISELRKRIKGLPGDMIIMMDVGDGVLESVCAENSQVVDIPLLEDDEDENDITPETETIELLLLVPCSHECLVEVGEINSQPELN